MVQGRQFVAWIRLVALWSKFGSIGMNQMIEFSMVYILLVDFNHRDNVFSVEVVVGIRVFYQFSVVEISVGMARYMIQ